MWMQILTGDNDTSYNKCLNRITYEGYITLLKEGVK